MKDSDNSAFVVNYRDISDYMMNGIIEMIRRNDGSFEITYANDAVKRTLFGEKNVADDELTMDPFDLIYPADRERVRDAIEKCSEDGFVSETYRVVNCEGKTVWVLGHLHMITIANRTYFIIIHTNVSELMGTQEHLQHEGDRLLDIVNSIPMGIAIFRIDDKGQSTVISINDQMVYFADAIGNYLDGNERHWTKEELTMLFNQSIYAFCDNNDIPLVSEMLEESKKRIIRAVYSD